MLAVDVMAADQQLHVGATCHSDQNDMCQQSGQRTMD